MKVTKLWLDTASELFGEEELSLITTDSVHQNIHVGRLFHASTFVESMADDEVIEFLVRVAAGKSAHFQAQATLGGIGTLQLFEGPTNDPDGAAQATPNRNRFSSNVATTLIFLGPTVTVAGTELELTAISGGSGGNAVGASANTFLEWILNPGDYLVRLKNLGGAGKVGGLSCVFYEPALS
jgi:hypothetical protein